MEIYCANPTALRNRGGSAVVSVHPSTASMGSTGYSRRVVRVSTSFGGLAQLARVFRRTLNSRSKVSVGCRAGSY